MEETIISNPWKGLESYQEADIIYGREEEIKMLYTRVIYNTQTVVYGKSGIGKSSIINAGIVPKAKLDGLFPISIRLVHAINQEEEIPYIDQIKQRILEELSKQGGDLEEVVAHSPEHQETLWELMHRHRIWLGTGENKRQVVPLLLFDQFEEIFSLETDPKRTDDFFAELADLLNEIMPNYLHPSNTQVKEIEENKVEFEIQDNIFGDIIKEEIDNKQAGRDYIESSNFHFVFILREDFLSYLERSTAYIPVMKSNRFPILPLNDEQAFDIIMKPQKGLIDEDVAELIIKKVTKKDVKHDGVPETEVDASILSLYLNRLFLKKGFEDKITADLVNQFSEDIIKSFYEESITGFSEKDIERIEDRLLTHDGHRNNVSKNDLGHEISDKSILNTLVNDRKILRQFSYQNDIRVELIHDILCPIVKDRIEQRGLLNEQHKLLAEKEIQRIEKNREYNRKKRLNGQNVLTIAGRKLIDNSLDFGENRTAKNDNYPSDNFLLAFQPFNRFLDNLRKDENASYEAQKIFHDANLSDAEYTVSFVRDGKRTSTSDGIYELKIKYKHDLITDITFYGKNTINGIVDYATPLYIHGGFCSIHQEYDEFGRVIIKEYRDENDVPIKTIDGYSIMRVEYDDSDNHNPIKVRYFDIEDGEMVACKHKNGNFGFDSQFDIAGNEIARHFIGEDDGPTTIISGVFGKKMVYDKDTFLLLELSNVDVDGKLTSDLDGYVTEKFKYDEEGREIKNQYFDKEGALWLNNDLSTGNETVYEENYVKIYNLGDKGIRSNVKDGYCETICELNEIFSVKSFAYYDIEGNRVCLFDNAHKMSFEYDQCGRIDKMVIYDVNYKIVGGVLLDFNKAGNHVLRKWFLNSVGRIEKDKERGGDVYGIEYELELQPSLPILQRFVNNNNQWVPCKDGYFAFREWKDEKDRETKIMFYDTNGDPMSDADGIYGIQNDFVDDCDNVIIQTYLDQFGNPMEDNNGVCHSKQIINGDENSVFLYDKEDNPSIGWGNHGVITTSSASKSGKLEQTKMVDTEGRVIKTKYAKFDQRGHEICSWTVMDNAELELLDEDEKACYMVNEYSEDGETVITYFLDADNQPVVLSNGFHHKEESHDEFGRLLKKMHYNYENKLMELDDGSYGSTTTYDDENRIKAEVFLDADGNPFLYRETVYDEKEREIFGKEYDESHNLIRQIEREFVENERQVCAYYTVTKDENGHIIPSEEGSEIQYIENDWKARTTLMVLLDEEKKPTKNGNDEYGRRFLYNDVDNIEITICLDEKHQEHNNKKHYSRIVEKKDNDGNTIREEYRDTEGNLVEIEYGSCGHTFEFLPNGGRIVGYIGKDGKVEKNSRGFAYKEIIENQERTLWDEFYYDEHGKNVIPVKNEFGSDDELGDYGKRYDRRENILYTLGFDECGFLHVNKQGYFYEVVTKDEEDRDRQRSYRDEKGDPVPDKLGDFARGYEYLSDGSGYTTISLDKKENPHNNDLGFNRIVRITDCVGDTIKLCYTLNDKEIIPHRTFIGYVRLFYRSVKQWINGLNKGLKDMINHSSSFTPRQMGAIGTIVLARQEKNGLAKKNGIVGCYVLIQLDDWNMFDEVNKLGETLKRIKTNPKHIKILPIMLDGPIVIEYGELISMDLPKGKLGLRMAGWKVNQKTIEEVIEIINESKNDQ